MIWWPGLRYAGSRCDFELRHLHYDWTGEVLYIPWLFMCTLSVWHLSEVFVPWRIRLNVVDVAVDFPRALLSLVSRVRLSWELLLLRKRQRHLMTRTHAMYTAGCTVALVGLVLSSLAVVGDTSAYMEFWDNTMKHKGTSSLTHGVANDDLWDPAHVGRKPVRP